MIIFERDRGPICYTAEIFYEEARPNMSLPNVLLSSGLDWFWESARLRNVAKEYAYLGLPFERQMTRLTVSNSTEFSNDTLERNIDGYGRFIALFGTDADSDEIFSDTPKFRSALRDFVVSEAFPIRMIVIQVGDSPSEHVFVPHKLINEVQNLLKIWKIESEHVKEIYPYHKLYSATLESLYKL